MKERQCSRQEVVEHYSRRALDDDMRSQVSCRVSGAKLFYVVLLKRVSFFVAAVLKHIAHNHYWSEAEAGLLNKRLILSSSFRCEQIYKYEIYNFGHTLLCYLSLT